jgi:hypothetical protein
MVTVGDVTLAEGTISGASATLQRTYFSLYFIAPNNEGHFILSALQMGE